jgi:hypothetical protein
VVRRHPGQLCWDAGVGCFRKLGPIIASHLSAAGDAESVALARLATDGIILARLRLLTLRT